MGDLGEFWDYFGYVVLVAMLGAAWIGLSGGSNDE